MMSDLCISLPLVILPLSVAFPQAGEGKAPWNPRHDERVSGTLSPQSSN